MALEKSITVETKTALVYLRADGILQIDIKANQVLAIKDVEELIASVYEIGKGKKFKNLVVFGEHTIVDVEGLRLSASLEGSLYKKADAFVIAGLPQRIISDFYLRIIRPVTPTVFFTNVTDAEKWLAEVE
jgi:hypothetical protein